MPFKQNRTVLTFLILFIVLLGLIAATFYFIQTKTQLFSEGLSLNKVSQILSQGSFSLSDGQRDILSPKPQTYTSNNPAQNKLSAYEKLKMKQAQSNNPIQTPIPTTSVQGAPSKTAVSQEPAPSPKAVVNPSPTPKPSTSSKRCPVVTLYPCY